MSATRQATEQVSLDDAWNALPESERYARILLGRLQSLRPLPPESTTIVDIGAAQGSFVISCARLGYRALGIEPWDAAREAAAELIARAGVDAQVLPGAAEGTGLPAGQYDVVVAKSVIEHVNDAQASFDEMYRLLKPGGLFWFCTASSRCPRQHEIDAFPLFGWYPDPLKRRVMAWAQQHKPHLIGHTATPAIHWFTRGKAERMLRQAGFRGVVYDRWDLRQPSEGGTAYQAGLRFIQLGRATKFLADLLLPGCAFAAIK